jgi:hypothetical protein
MPSLDERIEKAINIRTRNLDDLRTALMEKIEGDKGKTPNAAYSAVNTHARSGLRAMAGTEHEAAMLQLWQDCVAEYGKKFPGYEIAEIVQVAAGKAGGTSANIEQSATNLMQEHLAAITDPAMSFYAAKQVAAEIQDAREGALKTDFKEKAYETYKASMEKGDALEVSTHALGVADLGRQVVAFKQANVEVWKEANTRLQPINELETQKQAIQAACSKPPALAEAGFERFEEFTLYHTAKYPSLGASGPYDLIQEAHRLKNPVLEKRACELWAQTIDMMTQHMEPSSIAEQIIFMRNMNGRNVNFGEAKGEPKEQASSGNWLTVGAAAGSPSDRQASTWKPTPNASTIFTETATAKLAELRELACGEQQGQGDSRRPEEVTTQQGFDVKANGARYPVEDVGNTQFGGDGNGQKDPSHPGFHTRNRAASTKGR